MDFLMLPGLGSSGPAHWQTLWEQREPRFVRVEQDDWDHPVLSAWLRNLDRAVQAAHAPVILVAHSLACSLCAHWAARYDTSKVVGALLVSPADIESESCTPPQTRNFAPWPRQRLPFTSIVIASQNDPYVPFACAGELANAWGSQLVDAGAIGHINADSRLGDWPQGRAVFEQLLARCAG